MRLNVYITLTDISGCLLPLVIHCASQIFNKYLSIKRDKQFLDFIHNKLPDNTHVTIADGDTLYKADKGDSDTEKNC